MADRPRAEGKAEGEGRMAAARWSGEEVGAMGNPAYHILIQSINKILGKKYEF